MKKKILITATFLTIIFLGIISYISPAINEIDACLCTEILSNDSFLSNKNKMPSVNRCITTFKDFEKLCDDLKITIIEKMVLNSNYESNKLLSLFPNLFGEIALYRFCKK